MTAVLAVVLVLIVAAFIVSPFLRQAHDQPLATGPAGNELWAREKAVAVLAITEADFDRATGKLSDDDYRTLRSDYEGRALQAMDELEKLETTAAKSVSRFCGGCGNQMASVDIFCGTCGRSRGSF